MNQPTEPERRRAVPVDDVLEAFRDLPPMSLERFRADQEKYVDGDAHFDAYLLTVVPVPRPPEPANPTPARQPKRPAVEPVHAKGTVSDLIDDQRR